MPSPPARDRSADLPWFLVPFARLPLPGWAICLVIALTITVLNVAMEFVFGQPGPASVQANSATETARHIYLTEP